MDFPSYAQIVRSRFETVSHVDALYADYFYDEHFELKWLATKLKEFSLLSYMDHVDGQRLREYSARCTDFALQTYRGTPRGIQNGIVSFNVLAASSITQDAADFATSRPPKHFAAFEMPVVVDLQRERLLYYNQTPLWGMIYYKHFREYIEKSFGFSV